MEQTESFNRLLERRHGGSAESRTSLSLFLTLVEGILVCLFPLSIGSILNANIIDANVSFTT